MIIREFKKEAGQLKMPQMIWAVCPASLAIGAGQHGRAGHPRGHHHEEMSENIKTLAKEADNMSHEARAVSATAEEISLNMNTVAAAVEELGRRYAAVLLKTPGPVHHCLGGPVKRTWQCPEALDLWLGRGSGWDKEATEVVQKFAGRPISWGLKSAHLGGA